MRQFATFIIISQDKTIKLFSPALRLGDTEQRSTMALRAYHDIFPLIYHLNVVDHNVAKQCSRSSFRFAYGYIQQLNNVDMKY